MYQYCQNPPHNPKVEGSNPSPATTNRIRIGSGCEQQCGADFHLGPHCAVPFLKDDGAELTGEDCPGGAHILGQRRLEAYRDLANLCADRLGARQGWGS